MTRIAAVALVGLLPLSAVAQTAPPGWSDLLGKTCRVATPRWAYQANFAQGADGPSVKLTGATSRTTRVLFPPAGGISFDGVYNAGQYSFVYDGKAKTWSGSLSGLQAYLTCQ